MKKSITQVEVIRYECEVCGRKYIAESIAKECEKKCRRKKNCKHKSTCYTCKVGADDYFFALSKTCKTCRLTLGTINAVLNEKNVEKIYKLFKSEEEAKNEKDKI